MTETPPEAAFPLTLADRWVLREERSRDALGVWHVADDLTLERAVQIFQLRPFGTEGSAERVEWPSDWPANTIRSIFRQEIIKLQRLRIAPMRRIYEVFEEGETIWIAQSLEERRLGTIDDEDFARLLLSTAEGLAPLHQRSRLLLPPAHAWSVSPDGLARFRTPGLTLAWVADAFGFHSQAFNPITSPPELLEPNTRRGPGTDFYLVAASLVRLMTGHEPQEAVDDLRGSLKEAVSRCLDPRLDARPQSAEELRDLLSVHRETSAVRVWKQLDQKRKMLHMLRVEPMACPACSGVLERPEPLDANKCPTCREGDLEKRRLEERVCPSCRVGILQHWEASDKPVWCPECVTGKLEKQKKGLARKLQGWICRDCEALVAQEPPPDWAEINQQVGRAPSGWECDVCTAQFDEMPDGRWRRMTQDSLQDGWTILWPDEWSRVAVGLSPDASEHQCTVCGSSYYKLDRGLTLAESPLAEPPLFVRDHMEQLLTPEAAAQWAVGLHGTDPQLVCGECRTAFLEEEELRLIRSSHPLLRSHIGEAKSLPNWRRTALDLPETGEEENLEADLRAALAEGYRRGQIDLNTRKEELVWDGVGELDLGRRSRPVRLTIFRDHIRYRRAMRQFRVELDEITELKFERESERIVIECENGDTLPFAIEPSEWDIRLPSGSFKVTLSAFDLAARLRRELRGQTKQRSGDGPGRLAAEIRRDPMAD